MRSVWPDATPTPYTVSVGKAMTAPSSRRSAARRSPSGVGGSTSVTVSASHLDADNPVVAGEIGDDRGACGLRAQRGDVRRLADADRAARWPAARPAARATVLLDRR